MMAKKTAAKKQTKKKATKKAAAKTTKKATAKAATQATTARTMSLTSTSGALTPQSSKGKATITPVAAFSQLKGYWDVLINIYGTVAVKAVSLTGSSLTFTILDPTTGTEFNSGQQFTVDLEDGESTYPGFPGTGQLFTSTLPNPYGYLLLSQSLLNTYLGSQVSNFSGPKRPTLSSL